MPAFQITKIQNEHNIRRQHFPYPIQFREKKNETTFGVRYFKTFHHLKRYTNFYLKRNKLVIKCK